MKALSPRQLDGLDKIVAPVGFKEGGAGFKQVMAPRSGGAGGSSEGGPGPGMSRKFGGLPGGPMGASTGGGLSRPGGIPPAGGMPSGGGFGAGGRSLADVWQQTPTMEEVWLAE